MIRQHHFVQLSCIGQATTARHFQPFAATKLKRSCNAAVRDSSYNARHAEISKPFAIGAIFAIMIARPAEARQDQQLWTGASASVGLGGKWRLSQDFVARFSDNRNGLYQIQTSTMLGYKLSKSVTLSGGYVHSPLYDGGDFQVVERRAREQISIDNFAEVGPGKLSGRLRMEQRWRDGQDGVGWRVRPYVKYSMPLQKSGDTSLGLSHELYVNLNTTGFQRVEGADRMRNMVAITTKLNKTIGLEAGYLNQYFFVRGRRR
jgi:hypothetical protein